MSKSRGVKKAVSRAPLRAGRPSMPGYDMMFSRSRKSLSWAWAVEHLSNAHNYFLATTTPAGRPHVMPVWGLWLDDAFYFSTGRQSRKARNLEINPSCVVCPEDASEAVILEGIAEEIGSSSLPRKFRSVYEKKYHWKMEGNEGPFYLVRPRVVFGFSENAENLRANPTRWMFNREGESEKR